jgi:hypothetical protein
MSKHLTRPWWYYTLVLACVGTTWWYAWHLPFMISGAHKPIPDDFFMEMLTAAMLFFMALVTWMLGCVLLGGSSVPELGPGQWEAHKNWKNKQRTTPWWQRAVQDDLGNAGIILACAGSGLIRLGKVAWALV